MNWKAVRRSAIGTSHQKQGIDCQDYGKYCIFKDVIVGAVADGAGSAKHSDVGSRLAVETVLKCFSEINEFPQKQDSQPLSQEEAQKVFAKIVSQVITELQKQADNWTLDKQELFAYILREQKMINLVYSFLPL